MRLHPMTGLAVAVILAGGCGGNDGGSSLPANAAPTARFTAECTQLTCTFSNTSTDPDGNIQSHEWTFGDDGFSTIAEPTHAYAAGGTYTVTLTTTDQAGASNSVSKEVSVPPPAGLVCGSDISPCTLFLSEESQITVTIISRDCTAKQVTLTMTITEPYTPVVVSTETVFTDGCNTPGLVGSPTRLGGALFVWRRGATIAAEVTSESDDPTRIGHTLRASGQFPNWTLIYEDGEHHGSAGEPDFNDLVMTMAATPWMGGGIRVALRR